MYNKGLEIKTWLEAWKLQVSSLRCILKVINSGRGLSTDSFYITQSGGSLCIVDEIRIRGIVDIDNILLNENLNIDGILVLRSNVNFLDNPKNIYVKGITVNTPSVSENNVISRYDFGEIDLYSRGISNYIKPRIYSIKRSIDNK
ncbi:hypothetical protein ING2D1G_0248 [Peptoniphilus sp. ING2-D1G]|nr:hypothetical protein ING2D1G_0248 [Peptoniphilus sp. ING2-D1G]